MTDQAITVGPLRVLKPYTPDQDTPGRKLRRRGLLGLFFFFCWFWGLAFAFFAPFLILIFAAPMAILAAICIWALPEETRPPDRTLMWLFFAFPAVRALWPDYLAIATGVLPWVTLMRLTIFPLIACFLITLSVSRGFRADLSAALKDSPLILRGLLIFNLYEIFSLVLTKSIFFSLDGLYIQEMLWYGMFFVAAWAFTKPGVAERWLNLFWMLSIPLSLMAIVEGRVQHVLWAGHVPSFLQIQDPSVQLTMAGMERAYTGRYRAEATFSTPLDLAEFFALSVPFALHVALNPFPKLWRQTAAITIPLVLLGVFFTNARLGSIGTLFAFGGYGLCWTLYQRRWNPKNPLASALTWGFPTFFGMFVTASLFVGHLKRLVWGGSETQASTDARKIQWAMGWPKVLHHPLGYGTSMDGVTLNFHQPGGLLTIDSGYLSILLEYGFFGFAVYYGTFAWGAVSALRHGLAARPGGERELTFLLPAGVSLGVFLLIKSVLSESGNDSLVFIILGGICALIHRTKAAAASASAVAAGSYEPVIQDGGPRRPRRPAIQPATP